jgi:hypothetical protein
VTLDLKPEIAAALEALASAEGLSVEDYLEQFVEKAVQIKPKDDTRSEAVRWFGKTGYLSTVLALPLRVVDDAIGQAREERAQHILGKHS